MCCSSPLNPQALFYDGYGRNFDDRALNILWSYHIQYLILKSGDSVHDHKNDNGKKLNHNNLYGNAITDWMRNN